MYNFSLQGRETDCSVQSIVVPHHGGIWKGFWRPKLISAIYAKPQEDLGTVPLHQMVMVVKSATYLHAYCYAVMAGSTFLSKEARGMFLLHLSKE